MATQLEIERQERMIAAMDRLSEALEVHGRMNGPTMQLAKALENFNDTEVGSASRLTPALLGLANAILRLPRVVQDFNNAVNRIPSSIRTRF